MRSMTLERQWMKMRVSDAMMELAKCRKCLTANHSSFV
jgi:hypothetical protein